MCSYVCYMLIRYPRLETGERERNKYCLFLLCKCNFYSICSGIPPLRYSFTISKEQGAAASGSIFDIYVLGAGWLAGCGWCVVSL
jgi:hypothetical protein